MINVRPRKPTGCEAGRAGIPSFSLSQGFDVPVYDMVAVMVCVCVAGRLITSKVLTGILTLEPSSPGGVTWN